MLKELAPSKEFLKSSTKRTVQLDRGELNNCWFTKALYNDVGVKLKFTFTLAEPKGGVPSVAKKFSAEPVKVPHPLKSGSVVVPKLSFSKKNESIITVFLESRNASQIRNGVEINYSRKIYLRSRRNKRLQKKLYQ